MLGGRHRMAPPSSALQLALAAHLTCSYASITIFNCLLPVAMSDPSCAKTVASSYPLPTYTPAIRPSTALVPTPCPLSTICRLDIRSRDRNPPVQCNQGPPPPNPLVIERFQSVVSQLFQQVRPTLRYYLLTCNCSVCAAWSLAS